MNAFIFTNEIFGKRWSLVLWVAFFLLVFIYFFWHEKQRRARMFGFAALVIFVLSLLRAAGLSFTQYHIWATTLPGKYFLPPYQPFSYFSHYAFIHFFASFLLTLAFALLVGLLLFFFDRRRTNRPLSEEVFVFFAGAFLVRWPLVLLYTGAGLLLSALFLFAERYIMKRQDGFSLAAIFLFLIPIFLLFSGELISVFGLSPLIMPM